MVKISLRDSATGRQSSKVVGRLREMSIILAQGGNVTGDPTTPRSQNAVDLFSLPDGHVMAVRVDGAAGGVRVRARLDASRDRVGADIALFDRADIV